MAKVNKDKLRPDLELMRRERERFEKAEREAAQIRERLERLRQQRKAM